MKKTLALILALIMTVAAFAACGKTETKVPEKEETAEVYGVYHNYFSGAPATLNTWQDTAVGPGTLRSLTTAWAYNDYHDEDGNGWHWVCEFAEDFPQKMDEEGKVWRFTMRKDFCWANGDPITIDDWIYSVQMLIDPIQKNVTANSVTASLNMHVVNCENYANGECSWEDVGIKKIDDYTAEITGTYGVPQVNAIRFISAIALVYKPLYEAGMSEDRSITNWGTSVDTYMSCGPFVLTEWIPDAKFTLTRNEKYVHSELIHIEGIDYKVVPDSETAIQLFMTGELDYCTLAFSDWEKFEDDPRVYEYFDDSLMYMFVNLGNPDQNNLLGSLNFREAINHGIDRNEIADTISCYPATRYVRKSVIGNLITMQPFVEIPQDYVKTPEELHDTALANEYLAKAYEEKGLESAKVEFLQSETATVGKASNEMLQKQFDQVFGGKLTASIRIVPTTIKLRRWDPENPTSYELTTGSLLPSATDPRASFRFFTSDYNPPRTKWSNAEFDELYNRAMLLDLYSEENADTIIEMCQKMEKIMLDDLVVIPLYEKPDKVLYSERVHLPVDHFVIGYGFGERYMTISE